MRRAPRPPGSRRAGVVAALLLAAVLAGCGSAPRRGGDGPGANPPPNVASLPDAEPRIEPIKPGGANKPYQVLGHDYVPMTRDAPYSERGLASWYGRQFHGRRTASGETYDMYAMTAAHPTLPIPSYARIRNPANGREIVVRINDRGPFHAGRIVDLSYAAAARLDLLRGVAPVELDRITFEEIRVGSWRRDGAEATRQASSRSASPVIDTPAEGAAARMAVTTPTAATAATPPLMAAPSPPSPKPTPGLAPELSSVAALSVDAAEPAATAPPVVAPVAHGFWVQLGAFREQSGADSFQHRVAADVDWLTPRLATFPEAALYRVQAGPYASREEAQVASSRIREALGLVPVIVERR